MTLARDFDEIAVGDTRTVQRTITEADVRRFVEMTGDDNPLHVDPHFAGTTPFKDVVVHGMLGASFLSTVIGTQLPGTGALWVSQDLQFLLPVRLGDQLTVGATVVAKHERDRLLDLDTRIVNQHHQVVLSGRGRVKVLEVTAPEPTPEVDDRRRVAVVTGAAGGIGRAVVRRLTASGLDVVANYHRRTDQLDRLLADAADDGAQVAAVQADISTEDGARALVDAAVTRFGAVDVLVNNASPRLAPRRLADLDWGTVQAQLDVQVRAALVLSQLVVPGMADRGHGRIVNVTSQVVDGPPTAGWTAYAMAKGALAVLSRYLAAEVGPQGITVNCVSPGMTQTPLIGDVPEKAQLIAARQTPLRRLARPEDVAAAVAYLVSPDASFVTGQTLAVDGGAVMR